MSRTLPIAVALLGCLRAADALAAAGVEHHEANWWLLVFQILNVAVLGFLLFYFGRSLVTQALRDRSRGIRREIDEARTRLREVEAENAELRARLERVDAESRELIEQVESQARAERERGALRAAQTAEHIGEEARRVADNEIERARQVLRDDAAALAMRLAGEILAERIRPEDDRRLVREFVERVGSGS